VFLSIKIVNLKCEPSSRATWNSTEYGSGSWVDFFEAVSLARTLEVSPVRRVIYHITIKKNLTERLPPVDASSLGGISFHKKWLREEGG
jgi:hypothetical protein